jgi:hypothetical protein
MSATGADVHSPGAPVLDVAMGVLATRLGRVGGMTVDHHMHGVLDRFTHAALGGEHRGSEQEDQQTPKHETRRVTIVVLVCQARARRPRIETVCVRA